ncbi:Hypothetical protein NTJ_05244 [Nesidiocoris tenuis]|uniref:Uncharacterized protein n=1 Tax=Nesidiocoris tenuis TaxID=355587 RepID=A0ABN7AK57_9HEMI|nr:Hypothetical protein NTJ_05244 [Nesidiocoris tenuis]
MHNSAVNAYFINFTNRYVSSPYAFYLLDFCATLERLGHSTAQRTTVLPPGPARSSLGRLINRRSRRAGTGSGNGE